MFWADDNSFALSFVMNQRFVGVGFFLFFYGGHGQAIGPSSEAIIASDDAIGGTFKKVPYREQVLRAYGALFPQV